MDTKETQKNTAWRRVKYLTLMQIGDQLRGVKKGSKKKLAASISLKLLFTVIMTAVFIAAFWLFDDMFSLSASRNMLISLLFITQLVSIISCLSGMILVLFVSKENTMLLAFPCKYSEIFLSKIIVFALEEFKKSLYFILPLLIGVGVNAGVGVAYWLQLPIVWILLCLLPVFLGATLAIPAIYIKRFLSTYVWLNAILLIGLFVGAFFGMRWILSFVPIPLKLVAQYGEFIAGVNKGFEAINSFALFYNFIGKAMFGELIYLYLPLSLLVLAGCGVLCFLVAMPFYFKAASATAENSSKKKHSFKYKKYNNLFLTFFRKEMKIHFRSSEMVSSIIMTVFLYPIILYVLNFILRVINPSAVGEYIIIGFNIMITLSLLGTHNANSAAALSMEGDEFAILKTAPSNTSVIAWAKLSVTAIINLLSLVVTACMWMMTTTLGTTNVILLALTILFISIGQIAWNFEFDIRKPKIADYAAKGDGVTDNGNVAKAIAVSFAIATVLGLVSMLLFITDVTLGWVRLTGFAFLFLLARLYLLSSNLKVYFSDIQG